MKRLENSPTLRIDTSHKLILNYRGKKMAGAAGDTVATALYANGVRTLGRSLKYHRPRGLYSLDGECANAMMEVDGVPNVSTEKTLLRDGMTVKPQNVIGTPEKDLMGFMDKLSPFMPAGFYYKMMHKPEAVWPLAIKQLRKAAGLGRISPDFRIQGTFDEIYPAADVIVIGGGPAGLSAALAAAEYDLRVILLEARPWLGGCFDYRTAKYDADRTLHARAAELAGLVESHPNIRVFKHTTVVGTYTNNLVTAFQQGGEDDVFTERYIEIRAGGVVTATGCIERPLLFENNERPGIMQVSCAHRLARTYGIMPGTEAVFCVGHDLGLEAALDLADLGLTVQAVADVRLEGQDQGLMEALTGKNIKVMTGWTAISAHGRRGVEAVALRPVKGGAARQIPCDLLVASAGLTPVNGPLILAHARMEYDDHTGYFLPRVLPDKMFAAGRMTGVNNPFSIEASGRLAGLKAAAACGRDANAAVNEAKQELANLPGAEPGSKWVAPEGRGAKTFICFDEDATVKNVKQAIDMGFQMPELIKRFATVGLGPGQGGIPGHNLPLLTARYRNGPTIPQPTNVRPPLAPVFLATYAGTHRDMCKHTPMHESQIRDGGVFRRIGVWKRARYFSHDLSCRDEILNVRNNVGLFDASTLGKFRIHGPDALKALQRVYVSDMSRIKPGRVKYSAMCNADGCVIDDGVVIKTGENDYYLTTSTGRAGQTAEWIRYHTRFDGWDFHIVNLTDAMGVINLSGPNARKVLEKVVEEDVSNQAFPFSGCRDLTIKGIKARAMRLGFVGELSYELHVPSSYMPGLWDLIEEAGREFNIRNFGVEAQNVLRLEKGHIILGQESEQRTNLLDLGLGFLWDRSKVEAQTVGAAALRQVEGQTGRLTLVGVKMEDPERPARDGSIIVDDRIRGHICTMRKSFTLNESVGLALVESELAEPETRLGIYQDECRGKLVYGVTAKAPFYDPEGKRMRS